jgi:hypothetical protein
MEKKKFPCSFCQKIACSLGKLHEHLITHYQFQCSTCSEKFKSRHALNVHGREDTCSSENQERNLTEENMQQMNEVTNNGGIESFHICQDGELVIPSPEKSITTENTNDITDTVKQFSSSLAEWQNLVSAIREENSEANKKEISNGVENHCAEIDADGDNSEGRSVIYKDNGNKKKISKDLEDNENQWAEIDASEDNSEERRIYEGDGHIADDKVTSETGNEKQNHCMTNRPDQGHDCVSNKKKSTVSKLVQRKHRIKKDKFIVSNALFNKKNKGGKLAGWNKNFKSVTKKSVVDKKRLKENENAKDISGSVLTEKADKMHKEKNNFKVRKNEKIKDNPEGVLKERTDKLEEKKDSFEYRKGQYSFNTVDINQDSCAIGGMASDNVNIEGATSSDMVGKALDTVGYNSESDTNSGESGDDNSDGYTSVSGDINEETDLVSDNDSDGYEECTVEEIQAMLTGHNKQ